jgi:hypothetical protein
MSVASANQDLAITIRPDLSAAITRALDHIASPGAWWTGAERLAIVTEVRRAFHCPLCAERKAALSPYGVAGEHDGDSTLPAAIIDMVHRIASDPGRISKRLYDDTIAAGIEAPRYAETLGVIVRTVNMEYFYRALGLASPDLPAAQAGDPSGRVPDGLAEGEAWLPMLPTRHAEFDGRALPNVGRAMSSAPAEVLAMADLATAEYMDMSHVADPTYEPGRAINRSQMELIAGRVSAINECFY